VKAYSELESSADDGSLWRVLARLPNKQEEKRFRRLPSSRATFFRRSPQKVMTFVEGTRIAETPQRRHLLKTDSITRGRKCKL